MLTNSHENLKKILTDMEMYKTEHKAEKIRNWEKQKLTDPTVPTPNSPPLLSLCIKKLTHVPIIERRPTEYNLEVLSREQGET